MADASRGTKSGVIDWSPRVVHAVAAAFALGAISSLAPAVLAGERSDAGVDADDARTNAILGTLDPAAERRGVRPDAPALKRSLRIRPGRATVNARRARAKNGPR